MTRSDVRVVSRRGWELVQLVTPELEVELLPQKGGDIVAVRWRATGVDVLWTTPWGLRGRGAVPTAGDSVTAFMETYHGGWQTLFPNAGSPAQEQGVELGFHGEAALAYWDWEQVPTTDGVAVDLTTTLVRSPFHLHRRVQVVAGQVTVTERFTNQARTEQEAMWIHHPAFGAPFLDSGCTVDVGARAFLADAAYDTPNGDLAPGVRSAWPHAQGKDGGTVDLRAVPSADAQVDRYGYLLDFTEPRYTITNPELDLAVTVTWDADVLPHAWYWLEASGSAGFPWHQRAYVLAIEPAASYPGAGLQAAREQGQVVRFAPGQTRTATVCLAVGPP